MKDKHLRKALGIHGSDEYLIEGKGTFPFLREIIRRTQELEDRTAKLEHKRRQNITYND